MTKYATGNPVGSSDPRDLYDNAQNFDEAVNSEGTTFNDRTGKSRLTLKGMEQVFDGGQPAIDAYYSAVEEADRAAAQVPLAAAEADRSEAAADAAFVNADVYPDVATGRAAVADGEQFQVVEGGDVVRYRRDSASTQTQVASYPSANGITKILYEIPDNKFPPDFDYGSALDLRGGSSVVSIPANADGLIDRGYLKCIDWRSGGNEYARYSSGVDLNGQWVFGAFLIYSENQNNLDHGAMLYAEDGGGGLLPLANATYGRVDISTNLKLRWRAGQVDTAGYENVLLGSIQGPEAGTSKYATGFTLVVQNAEPDVGSLVRNMLLRDSARNNIPGLIDYKIANTVTVPAPEVTSTGEATLVLAGTGNVESYVESGLSGSKIKRTFVAFPNYEINSPPVVFNFKRDYINDTEVRAQGDDVAPDHVLGTTLGGSHGFALGTVPSVSHGKTQDDQGSIWTDGTNEYLLVSVKDSDTLLMTRRDINTSSVPAGIYTHVSGAVNTGDITAQLASTYSQWYPPFNNRHMKLIVDGEEVAERSGTFSYRKSVQFIESYDVLDRSEIVAWWEVNGSSGNLVPEGEPSYTVSMTYEFDKDGQCTIYRDFLALKPIEFSDMMGLQAGRAAAITEYYVPTSVEFVHDSETVNYALKEPADRTSSGGLSSVNFTPAEAQASGLFIDRVISLAGASYVFAMGFLPVADTSLANRRTQCSSKALEIRGNTDKLYMRVVDKGNLTLSPGEQFSTIGYRHILPAAPERTDAYTVRTQGADYFFVDWHGVQGFDRVPIPSDLAGRDFEVVEARNAVLKNTVLTGSLSVDVSAVGDYAYLVIKVG